MSIENLTTRLINFENDATLYTKDGKRFWSYVSHNPDISYIRMALEAEVNDDSWLSVFELIIFSCNGQTDWELNGHKIERKKPEDEIVVNGLRIDNPSEEVYTLVPFSIENKAIDLIEQWQHRNNRDEVNPHIELSPEELTFFQTVFFDEESFLNEDELNPLLTIEMFIDQYNAHDTSRPIMVPEHLLPEDQLLLGTDSFQPEDSLTGSAPFGYEQVG